MPITRFKFPVDLVLRRKRKGDGSLFHLEEEYRVAFFQGDQPTVVKIPKGFATDGPSVPGLFQSSVSVLDAKFEAAVVHDWLYAKGYFHRGLADEIFLAGMKAAGVGWWQRKKTYRAVRMFGWAAWNKHRKND